MSDHCPRAVGAAASGYDSTARRYSQSSVVETTPLLSTDSAASGHDNTARRYSQLSAGETTPLLSTASRSNVDNTYTGLASAESPGVPQDPVPVATSPQGSRPNVYTDPTEVAFLNMLRIPQHLRPMILPPGYMSAAQNNDAGSASAEMPSAPQDPPVPVVTSPQDSRSDVHIDGALVASLADMIGLPQHLRPMMLPTGYTSDAQNNDAGSSSAELIGVPRHLVPTLTGPGLTDQLAAMHDLSPLERRRILAQYFDNIELPDGESAIIRSRQPDPFYDGSTPVASTPHSPVQLPIRNAQNTTGPHPPVQLPSRNAQNTAGEEFTGVTVTSADGTVVGLEPSVSLTNERLRHHENAYQHSLDIHNNGPINQRALDLFNDRIQASSDYRRDVAISDAQHPSTTSPLSGGSNHSVADGSVTDHEPSQLGLGQISRPRWQPDAEVTLCPICGTQFSFFVRKHHCRKCGRVVCSSCSPHRITIPNQFIAHPPQDPTSPGSADQLDLPGPSDTASVATSVGGGQRVRLCNPCVPDPNTAPPQTPQHERHLRVVQPRSHARSASMAGPVNSSESLFEGNGQRRHGVAFVAGNQPQPASQRSPQTGGRRSTVSSAASGSSSHLPDNAPSTNVSEHRRSLHGGGALIPQLFHVGSRANRVSIAARINQEREQRSAPSRRQTYVPPTGQPDDSDHCPVCHCRLPSHSPNPAQLEALRETHINQCIESSIRGSRSVAPPSQASGSAPIPTPQGGPSSVSSTTPSTSEAQPSTSGRSNPPLFAGRRPRRGTCFFPYKATEKDCVDDAECTICFEEFEVGVDMARLECFCRFHLDCITRWFENRPGQCPVHQHDSGY